MKIPSVVLVMAAVWLASCGYDPLGAPPAPYFLASLDGAFDEVYSGSGEFHTGTPGPGRQQFQIISRGNGESVDQSFALTRWDGGRLSKGTYSLDLVDLSNYQIGVPGEGQPTGITMQYFRTGDVEEELFVAETGELRITRSSPSGIEGHFSFEGFRYCVRSASEPWEFVDETLCAWPPNANADAPRIHVSGSFVAVPFDAVAVPAQD
jgi:hypothetical protein